MSALGEMTLREALQTATLDPAKAIVALESQGSVIKGNMAAADGRYFDHATLDALGAEACRYARAPANDTGVAAI